MAKLLKEKGEEPYLNIIDYVDIHEGNAVVEENNSFKPRPRLPRKFNKVIKRNKNKLAKQSRRKNRN